MENMMSDGISIRDRTEQKVASLRAEAESLREQADQLEASLALDSSDVIVTENEPAHSVGNTLTHRDTAHVVVRKAGPRDVSHFGPGVGFNPFSEDSWGIHIRPA